MWEIIQLDSSALAIGTYNNILNDSSNCADFNIDMVVKVALSDERGAVGVLLKNFLKGSLTLFEYNSPFIEYHLENFTTVNPCTLGGGAVEGKVVDADSGSPIKNARISVEGAKTIKTTYTDSRGKFYIEGSNANSYDLQISATSYMTYKNRINIVANNTTYVEPLMMIERANGSATGNIYGNIIDSVTGRQLSDVLINVHKDWNNTDGEILNSYHAETNLYTLDLAAGNYTLEFVKDGYFTTNINVYVLGNVSVYKQVDMAPMFVSDIEGFRVVLTWGATPSDLDSHLTGPTVVVTVAFILHFIVNDTIQVVKI